MEADDSLWQLLKGKAERKKRRKVFGEKKKFIGQVWSITSLLLFDWSYQFEVCGDVIANEEG